MASVLARIAINSGGLIGTFYWFDLWQPAKRPAALAVMVWYVALACWFSYGDGGARR